MPTRTIVPLLFLIAACSRSQPIIPLQCGSDADCGPGDSCTSGFCPRGAALSGPPDFKNTTLSVTSSPVYASGRHAATIQLVVRDAAGKPVGGQLVTVAASGSGNLIRAGSVASKTNYYGAFYAYLYSTKAEQKTITVTAGTVTRSQTVTFIPSVLDKSKSGLSASTDVLTADGSSSTALTVTVLDVNSNPVPGRQINLSVPGARRGYVFSPAAGTTDQNGQFASTLTGTTAGTVTIAAGVPTAFTLTHSVQFLQPISIAVAPVTLRAGGTASAPVSATDPQKATITLSLPSSAPSWASLIATGPGTAQIALAPPPGGAQSLNIGVDAIDSVGAVGHALLAVTVQADHPPDIAVQTEIGDVGSAPIFRQGGRYDVKVSASSADGWPVTFTVTPPAAGSFNPALNVWSWAPSAADIGTTQTLHVQASDGVVSASRDVAITAARGLVAAQDFAGIVASDASPVILDRPPKRYAIVADHYGLAVFDVTGDSISRVAHVQTPGNAEAVAVLGTWAFVADGIRGLAAYDVTDPAHPAFFAELNDPGDPGSVIQVVADPATNRLAATLDNGELRIYDLGGFLAAPTPALSWTTISPPDASGGTCGVFLGRPTFAGGLVWVGDETNGIFYLYDPAAAGGPAVVNQYRTSASATLPQCNADARTVDLFTAGGKQYGAFNGGYNLFIDTVDLTGAASGAPVSTLGTVQIGDFISTTALVGTKLYGGNDWYTNFDSVDLSNPAAPVKGVAAGWDNGIPVGGVAVSADGTRIYLSKAHFSLQIFDPTGAQLASGAEAPAAGWTSRDGNLAVAVQGQLFSTWDPTQFPSPVLASVLLNGSLDGTTGQAMTRVVLRGTLAVSGEFLWSNTLNNFWGVRVRTWDVSTPATPVEIGHAEYTNPAGGLDFDAMPLRFVPGTNFVGVGGFDEGIIFFDVTDPAHPTQPAVLHPDDGSPLAPDPTGRVTEWISDGRSLWMFARAPNSDAGGFKIQLFDLGAPANPAGAALVGTSSFSKKLSRIVGAALDPAQHVLYFMATYNGSVYALDLTDPTKMTDAQLLSRISTGFGDLPSWDIDAVGIFNSTPALAPHHLIVPAAQYTLVFPRNADRTLGQPEILQSGLGDGPGGNSWIDGDAFVVRKSSGAEKWFICPTADTAVCAP